MSNDLSALEAQEKDIYTKLKEQMGFAKDEIKAQLDFSTDDDGVTNIRLYSPILPDAFFGATATEFAEALDGAGNVRVFIDSPGGSVFTARAIANQITRHRRAGNRVETVIDGLCASAATFIACASDEVIAGAGTRYMVHNSEALIFGNKDKLRDVADNRMEGVDAEMREMYARETGMDPEAIQALMDATTFMDAEEALRRGFVDRMADDATADARTSMETKITVQKSKEAMNLDKLVDGLIEVVNKRVEAGALESQENTKSGQEKVSASLSDDEKTDLDEQFRKLCLDHQASKLRKN